jgi:hypothetical protein
MLGYRGLHHGCSVWTGQSWREREVAHNLRTESIIDEREEENTNVDHVYTHHDDGGDQDDVGENDQGLDVEE